MSSTFDQAETIEDEQGNMQLIPVVSVYESCSKLFVSYQANDNLRIRGGWSFHNKETRAEPIDFCADITIKAKRCLTPREYTLWTVFSRSAETLHLMPPDAQAKLSVAWNMVFHDYLALFRQMDYAWKAQERREQRRKAARQDKAEVETILDSEFSNTVA
jgi:hypothetical protein